MNIVYFESPSEFRKWLEKNHAQASELWVGFYRKGSGRTGISYPEAVDEALCFGWIDGIKKKIDEISYAHRFTPRKPRSFWSAVNIAKVRELTARGRMTPAGLEAFEGRDEKRSVQYSYERESCAFDAVLESRFRANEKAWNFFQAQPPGYRRTATWWVVSAKREETRLKRLTALIEDSEAGRRLAQVGSPPKTKT
jgi:uncharacterized protein YdeI (YjbR/CyaY-like superfamily)